MKILASFGPDVYQYPQIPFLGQNSFLWEFNTWDYLNHRINGRCVKRGDPDTGGSSHLKLIND